MNRPPRVRRLAAALAVGVVAPSLALIATSAPAHAASISVSHLQFRWGLNNESNNAAFAPGTFNLFSAGKIGNPGAGGQTLKNADEGATWSNGATAGWKSTVGNVVIEKKQADGSYAATTWAGTKTDPNGAPVTVAGGKYTDHQVVINNGIGTLDAAADDADITWNGDFTALYYSGMTYFTVSDPHLVVDGGVGTVTATLGGYAADMNDLSKWNPLPDTSVTLATLTGVDVTDAGLIDTPDYLGVPYVAPSGASPQSAQGSVNYGSFPQSFVDFQQLTGSSSYWYSSGGSADSRKPTLPLQVTYPKASVTVSSAVASPTGVTTVTVTGSGFLPAAATGTRPPLAGRPTGAYVAFGKFPANWKPSAGVASKQRPGTDTKWAVLAEDMGAVGGAAAGAIELKPDGTFTAQVKIDKAAADTAAAAVADAVNYGIYTYPGGGAAQPAFETYTPIGFPSVSLSQSTVPDTGVTTVTVTGSGFLPAAATGTRPPLAGRPTGAYVAFGKFPANWKPSAGVASKQRPGTDTKWAVLAEDMGAVGGAAAGAIELKPDGTFTAQVKIDKAAADTAAAAVADAVNYGIYTYPGGGAAQPAFETYTPITFQAPVVQQPANPPAPSVKLTPAQQKVANAQAKVTKTTTAIKQVKAAAKAAKKAHKKAQAKKLAKKIATLKKTLTKQKKALAKAKAAAKKASKKKH